MRYSLSVLAGAALPLAFAPFGQFWLAPLCYAVLFYTWHDAPPRRALALGFLFGCASFGLGTYWTFIAVRVFGQSPLAVAALVMVGLTLVLAGFVAVAAFVAARWLPTRGVLAWLAGLPAVFALAEWLRGWLFTGFGWLAAGYSQTDSWLMGYAPVGGVHLMSLAVLASAGAVVTFVLGSVRERAAAAVVVAAIWGGGLALESRSFTAPRERALTVALAQGAIGQADKWRPEQLPGMLALYAELTRQSAGADLVIWPEAAIPTLVEYLGDYLDGVQRAAAEQGSAVVLGVLRLPPGAEPSSPTSQNIVMALTEPRQVYVKRHLVPFGEYFPVPDFVRSWLRLMSLPYTDAVPGEANQPPLEVAGEKLAITICYEDVFGAEQLASLPEATLLVNVANDAWFGDSIAPHQHLQIARVRAAEAGRYLLRSTNTGVSAVIDPRGAVVASVAQFEPAVLRARVQGYAGATPYARAGNYPAVVLALALLLGAAALGRRGARSASAAA